MQKLFSILVFLGIGLGAFSQAYTLDPTFQPAYNIRNSIRNIGATTDLWENPQTGIIYIVGSFAIPYPGQLQGGFSSMLRNGSRNLNFSFNSSGTISLSHIFKRPGAELFTTGSTSTVFGRLDTTGSVIPHFQQWAQNYLQTARCIQTYVPYFFDDGSYLMSKDYLPTGCEIINPPDTFPHRYIVKVTPQGLWDSSFVKDATGEPYYFIPYDSNRILVYGSPNVFTHYDGVPVHGMCRIYLDGTLDTTFQSPLGNFFGMIYNVVHIDSAGAIFIGTKVGSFRLRNYPQTDFTLIKLSPNGNLDTTFANFNGPYEARPNNVAEFGMVKDICPTPDGGYIVGGLFDTYQGQAKHNLAKIDANGIVDPNYFNYHGPDSSATFGVRGDSVGFVISIKKSSLGGYYVMGDFFTWNGAPVQGIVRITDLTVGGESHPLKSEKVKLFPNPTKNQLTISSSAPIEAIEVYDLLGKRVKHESFSPAYQQTIALSHLDNGIYFLKAKVGEQWISKKVVKR